MSNIKSNMSISILVTGFQQDAVSYTVGKKEILQKVCEKKVKKDEDENDKYFLKFPNFELNFEDISCRIGVDAFYQQYRSTFQKSAIIIIVYSRLYNDSYKFAKELYKIINSDLENIYFVETDFGCDDKLNRDEDFDQLIEDQVFKCDPFQNSKGDLLSIFLYISLKYQNTDAPIINVCFPKHDVRNLVATSEGNSRTFILTYKSIKMYSFGSDSNSNLFVNYQFRSDFTFYHPISLIANYDGTKLILVTAFKLYLIDKYNSHFDTTSYFLPDIHRINPVEIDHSKMPEKQVIDVQFLPRLPDFFAIIFPGKVQIYRITNDNRRVDFIVETNRSFEEEQFNIKLCRFRPFFDDMLISDLFKIYYLTRKGEIFTLSLDKQLSIIPDDLYSPIKLDTVQINYDNKNMPIIYFELKNGHSKRLDIDFQYPNKPKPLEVSLRNTTRVGNDPNKPNENTNVIIHGFDFMKNEIIVYGSLLNEPTFFHSTLKESSVVLSNFSKDMDLKKFDFNNVDGLYKIKDSVFVKTKDALYVFEYLKDDSKKIFIHKAIGSNDIVGFTNTPFSCIIAPGYIVSLSYYLTRVNPTETFKPPSAAITSILTEYQKFEKNKKDKIAEYEKESSQILADSNAIKAEVEEIHKKETNFLERAKDVGNILDKLEQEAKDLLRQLSEISPIQQKTKVLLNLDNQENLNLIIGKSYYSNAMIELAELIREYGIPFGIAFCQHDSISEDGNNDKLTKFAKKNAKFINCVNTFIICTNEPFNLDIIKQGFVHILAVTTNPIQISILVSQGGTRSISEIAETDDDESNLTLIYEEI